MSSSDAADLSSLARTAEGVLARVTGHAERYARSDREDVYGTLHEAERTLRSAVRQLERAAKLLD